MLAREVLCLRLRLRTTMSCEPIHSPKIGLSTPKLRKLDSLDSTLGSCVCSASALTSSGVSPQQQEADLLLACFTCKAGYSHDTRVPCHPPLTDCSSRYLDQLSNPNKFLLETFVSGRYLLPVWCREFLSIASAPTAEFTCHATNLLNLRICFVLESQQPLGGSLS